MPKVNRRTHQRPTDAARPTAEDLIAAVRGGTSTPEPSAAALAELRKICTYNDLERAPTKRVGQDEAIKLLRSYGWEGSSRTALHSLCRRSLGRKSWGAP